MRGGGSQVWRDEGRGGGGHWYREMMGGGSLVWRDDGRGVTGTGR